MFTFTRILRGCKCINYFLSNKYKILCFYRNKKNRLSLHKKDGFNWKYHFTFSKLS